MKIKFVILPSLLVLFAGCGTSQETLRLNGSAIEFHLVKGSEPGIFATYKGGTVTDSQIKDQDPVQADLHIQEVLIRLEAILRKFASDSKLAPGTVLEIFQPEPKKPVHDLAKSWGINLPPGVKISFKTNPPDKDVIAQWGDNQVKGSEADASSVRLALARARAYREELNRLTGILVRRSLLDAAKAENLQIEDYVKKHITANNSPVTDAEFEAFLNQRGIKKGDVNPDQEESLRNIAQEQRKSVLIEDYVVKNLLNGVVQVHEFPPTFTVQVPEGWASIWGVKDAPVAVLFFGDLVSGPSRDSLKSLLEVANENKGHLKLGFNFLFSRGDRDSRMISEAALCVQAQGTSHFRKFAELYATNPPGAEEAEIEKAARESGADIEKYKKCFLAREYQNLLNQHLVFAERVGVASQPTILIDGEPLAGAISKNEIQEVIERKVRAKSSALGALFRRIKASFSDS